MNSNHWRVFCIPLPDVLHLLFVIELHSKRNQQMDRLWVESWKWTTRKTSEWKPKTNNRKWQPQWETSTSNERQQPPKKVDSDDNSNRRLRWITADESTTDNCGGQQLLTTKPFVNVTDNSDCKRQPTTVKDNRHWSDCECKRQPTTAKDDRHWSDCECKRQPTTVKDNRIEVTVNVKDNRRLWTTTATESDWNCDN
jgi:hypothetical protein